MMSEFPEYDPAAPYGDPLGRAAAPRRTSYADLDAMQAAEPYEVAGVILRSVFQPLQGTSLRGRADPSRLMTGVQDCLRDYARGLFATLSGSYPAGFMEITARSLAIWRTALVADTLPSSTAAHQVLILIEPDVLDLGDAQLAERLRP